jgi:hypothetical protein
MNVSVHRKQGVLRKMLQRLLGVKEEKIYVRGSGYVHIPVARTNEIPKVIAEFHTRDCQVYSNAWLSTLRRA